MSDVPMLMLSACVCLWHLIKILREILREKINNIYIRLVVSGDHGSLLTDVHVPAPLGPGQHVDAPDVAQTELGEAAHQPGVVRRGVRDGVRHSAWIMKY